MAYWNGRGLKRNLERALELVTFIRPVGNGFALRLSISFVEWEDVGYHDNRALSLSLFGKGRRPIHWVALPLSLLEEFVLALKRYDPSCSEKRNLGFFSEYDGLKARFVVHQSKGDIHIARQVFWNSWENYDIVVIQKEEISQFFNFLKDFGAIYLGEIRASQARRKEKRSAWESAAPASR